MPNLGQYQYFIWQLTKTNVLARYKKTRLGLFWMLLTPILTVVIWVTLHSAGIFNPGDTKIAYPAYVFLSATLWAFFFEGYKAVSESVTFHSKLLLSHQVPYLSVVLERMGFHLANSIVPILVLIPVLMLFHVEFGWSILIFPLALIPLLIFGGILGVFVAVLKVVAVDFSNAIDELVKVVKYLTPVVYAQNIEMGFLSKIIQYNPLTYLIGLPRDLILNQEFLYHQKYISIFLCLIILSYLSFRFYRIAAPLLVERLFGN